MHFPYLSPCANDGIFENTVLPKCTKSSRLSEVVTSDFFKWEVKMALAFNILEKNAKKVIKIHISTIFGLWLKGVTRMRHNLRRDSYLQAFLILL